MEFADRGLKCVDCSAEFVFTAGEQFFFVEKQFTNDPKRCKGCKAKRGSKAQVRVPQVCCISPRGSVGPQEAAMRVDSLQRMAEWIDGSIKLCRTLIN